jgi:hypothetical protein
VNFQHLTDLFGEGKGNSVAVVEERIPTQHKKIVFLDNFLPGLIHVLALNRLFFLKQMHQLRYFR